MLRVRRQSELCPRRYLRELYANPSPGSLKTFMPSVVACLLKNLSFLEVLDIENLHDGIEHYYHNASIACSRYGIQMFNTPKQVLVLR